MTRDEIKEIEYMIDLTIRKDLSKVLQRLADKAQIFCAQDRIILFDELESISKEYNLRYIKRETKDV